MINNEQKTVACIQINEQRRVSEKKKGPLLCLFKERKVTKEKAAVE